MRSERNRVDLDAQTKFIVEDLVERGFYKDQQSVLAAALTALQSKLADETYTDEYYDEEFQEKIGKHQLSIG